MNARNFFASAAVVLAILGSPVATSIDPAPATHLATSTETPDCMGCWKPS